MEVTVLGRCGPFPAPGEACSGYLLKCGGKNIMLDFGSGVFSRLYGLLPRLDVDAVVLSLLHSVHMADMLIFRYALEQQAFALAIEQASESQMEALEELVKRLDRSMDEQENARIDKQIHFTLAQASGNVLLLNILEACSGVIDTFIRNMRAEILRTKEAKEALNLCHRQIAEALRNKDNAAGKDALDRHFRMIDKILEKNEKTHSM